MRFQPHKYQQFGLNWLIHRTILKGEAGAALFLDPGLGKTAITLAWIAILVKLGLCKRVLLVAPLRVVYSVWPQETQKWDQFTHLRVQIVHGSPKDRRQALRADADIYAINPEQVPWLVKNWDHQCDVLVIDESTKFKSWSAKRTKALKKIVDQFRYRLLLTGTPSPNSLEDLFSQVYMLDLGKALGTAITRYRSRYFFRGGYGGYKWMPIPGSQERIEKLIEPMCLRLSEKDHLDLPELLINDVMIDLPKDVRSDYKRLERELFVELESTGTVTATNAGAKYMMCRQLANGGLYADGQPEHIHTAKVERIEGLVDELAGKPALIAFQFRHDLERLRKVWPQLRSIDGRTSGRDASKLVDQWNAGELPLLAVQPQSLSHGVNLQSGPGRDLIWLGLTDNLEVYQQLNKRIYRQGVTGQVRVHQVLARGTVDLAIRLRLDSKDASQKALLDALNKYRHGHG